MVRCYGSPTACFVFLPLTFMEIYINRDGQPYGPFSKETCLAALTSGQLLNTDLAWREGMTEWMPLHAVLGAKVVPSDSQKGGVVQVFEYSDPKCTGRVAK